MTQGFFFGQSYINNNGAQNYLIFQPLHYTIKILGDIDQTVKQTSSLNLLILVQLMIVFLHQLSGTKIQSFV